MKKVIVYVICISLITSGIYITPTLAAEKSKETAIDTMTISTVKKGNAYIPKGTILKVELIKELSSKESHEGIRLI